MKYACIFLTDPKMSFSSICFLLLLERFNNSFNNKRFLFFHQIKFDQFCFSVCCRIERRFKLACRSLSLAVGVYSIVFLVFLVFLLCFSARKCETKRRE